MSKHVIAEQPKQQKAVNSHQYIGPQNNSENQFQTNRSSKEDINQHNREDNETIAMSSSSASKTNFWDPRLGYWAHNSNDNYSNSQLLSVCDQLLILRQFRLCNENNANNRYLIKNQLGENLFYGTEHSIDCCDADCCCCCCTGKRAFILNLFNRNQVSGLCLERPLKVGGCGLFPICLQEIIVKDNNHQIIGEVKQKYSLFHLILNILDENNETVLQVIGPNCGLTCIGDDIHFDIYYNNDSNGSKCGHICKKSEIRVCGHIFHIKFSAQLDFKLKASIIAATILIDFYYFEEPIREHKYHRLSMSSSESLMPFPQSFQYKQKSNK